MYRNKHKHQDLEDDDEDQPTPVAAAGLDFNQGHKTSGSFFPDGVATSLRHKRRKSNKGQALGFEPHFDALSLDTGVRGVCEDHSTLSSTLQPPGFVGREATPFPLPGAPTNETGPAPIPPPSALGHERGASYQLSPSTPSPSGQHARQTFTADANMKPASRHDPSRPHVVFVDSLSDSDENEADEEDATEEDTSTRPNTANSTSSDTSDMEEGGDPFDMHPSNGATTAHRPIKLNRRLREHLWNKSKQAYHSSGKGSRAVEHIFPTSDPALQERGLVLYRPLSYGIVEEPDDDESQSDYIVDDARFEELPDDYDDIAIEELGPSDPEIQPDGRSSSSTVFGGQDFHYYHPPPPIQEEGGSGDGGMDLD